jgi:hypothetical protein
MMEIEERVNKFIELVRFEMNELERLKP